MRDACCRCAHSPLHACMPICQPPPPAGLKQADPTLSGPHMITDKVVLLTLKCEPALAKSKRRARAGSAQRPALPTVNPSPAASPFHRRAAQPSSGAAAPSPSTNGSADQPTGNPPLPPALNSRALNVNVAPQPACSTGLDADAACEVATPRLAAAGLRRC
jgi:hypothetical protein